MKEKEIVLQRGKRYPIETKVMAIVLMESAQDFNYKDEFVPKYVEIAREMGIEPSRILEYWWKHKENIIKEGYKYLTYAQFRSAVKLNSISDELLEILKGKIKKDDKGEYTKDIENLKITEITKALETTLRYERLMANMSTANVATAKERSRGVEHIIPEEVK